MVSVPSKNFLLLVWQYIEFADIDLLSQTNRSFLFNQAATHMQGGWEEKRLSKTSLFSLLMGIVISGSEWRDVETVFAHHPAYQQSMEFEINIQLCKDSSFFLLKSFGIKRSANYISKSHAF